MEFPKEIYQKIWDEALLFQDKRDDKGHAEIVTKFAVKLCKLEKVNADVVIPAAILHDIGWSQLSDEERFIIFYKKATKKEKLDIRFRYQEEGTKLAREILKKVNYPEGFTKKILEIISEHDTRIGFLSPEDGAVRDADKLWRYSEVGLKADRRRRGDGFPDFLEKLKDKIEASDFFFSESARQMAREELEINCKKLNL